jgi:hypothetical protein
MMHKPFSESCEQNRDPILQVIGPLLRHSSSLLEIGGLFWRAPATPALASQ